MLAGDAVGDFDDSRRAGDENGVGQTVDGKLSRALSAKKAFVVDLAIFAEALGHGVERRRQMSHFIARSDWYDQIEFSRADAADQIASDPAEA